MRNRWGNLFPLVSDTLSWLPWTQTASDWETLTTGGDAESIVWPQICSTPTGCAPAVGCERADVAHCCLPFYSKCSCLFVELLIGGKHPLVMRDSKHSIAVTRDSARHLVELRVVEEVGSVSVNQGAEGQAVLPASPGWRAERTTSGQRIRAGVPHPAPPLPDRGQDVPLPDVEVLDIDVPVGGSLSLAPQKEALLGRRF